MTTKARTLLPGIFAAFAVAAAVLVLVALPPAPRQLTASAPPDPLVAAGALHIHTVRSDGGGTVDDVAAAAASAGLDFVVITDHGDAQRLLPPAYRSGVLCIDGSEISSDQGHVAGVGLRSAEYPLGGAARDVIDDVHRLGGLAIAAHPVSPRQELAWHAWDAPFDAIEWLNGDSEWRDERSVTIARTALGYWLRPAAAISLTFDRPQQALARADALAAERPVAFVAGHDAHARIARSGAHGYGSRGIPLPSYRAIFSSFAVRVLLDVPLTGDATADAAIVLRALNHGRVFTALDGLATPARLQFTARSGGASASIGDRLIPAGPIQFTVETNAPEGSLIVLLHNGRELASGATPRLTHAAPAAPGAYRVEVRVPDAPGSPPAPWIVSSPLWVGLPKVPPPARGYDRLSPIAGGEWVVEHAPTSAAVLSDTAGGAELRYELGAAGTSPYAALVRQVAIPAGTQAVAFTARADRPMRVSVQLRSPKGGGAGQRWRRSVFLDQSERTITLPLADFDPIPGTTGEPALADIDSLLFVVDTINTEAGSSGAFAVSALSWATQAP